MPSKASRRRGRPPRAEGARARGSRPRARRTTRLTRLMRKRLGVAPARGDARGRRNSAAQAAENRRLRVALAACAGDNLLEGQRGLGNHDRADHRRQDDRGGIARPRSRRRRSGWRASAGLCRGSRWCWSATIRRARSMSGSKTKATVGSGMRSFDHRLPASGQRGRIARRWSAGSTPIPSCTASWCSCRCRRGSTRRRCIAAIEPAKDVDGFHPINAGRLAAGLPALVALHAARLHHAREDRAAIARGTRGGGHRPLQHRRQAARPTAARRERHRNDRALAARATSPAVCRRADSVRGGRPAGNGPRVTGSSPGATVIDVGINRVPRTAARRGSSATLPSARRPRSPARSRRCPVASAR